MAVERNAEGSAPARLDQPSFFQHWERKARSGTQGDSINESRFSTDSSHPSPKSTISPARVRKLRQTVAERSISAPAGTIPELAIPTIANLKAQRRAKTAAPSDESSAGILDRHSRSADTFQQRRGSTPRVGADSKKSSMSSVTRRFRNHFRISLPDFRIPECRIANSAKELFPPRRERPGYEWTKAGPKDDWVERLISSSRIMQRRTRSTEPSPVPIVPLRPPGSRNVSGLGHHRAVRLETSFAKLRPDTPPEKIHHPRTRSRPSIATRTRTIIAKRVRFALHRDFSTDRRLKQRQSPCSTPLKSSLLSARNRTAEGLQRVASILRLMVSEDPSHAASDRSNQFREPISPTQLKHSHRKATFHLPSVIRTRARKSTSVSYTSSLRKMRRGATPLNTPDSRETYRVKRSPSVETEEFFKIDISIRGGTSYLPSEARRVHTPPLPGDGPGQKRMGFFFDYTAPSPAGSLVMDHPPSENEQVHSSPNVRPKRGKTVGGTDWYETQLAGVDAVGEEGIGDSKRESGLPNTGMGKEKEVVDLNVPEHLPSSPLCPRHPKCRSGGNGVCWMHGRNAE